uniref:Uncharacterized protein n=1 Tax=Attheya septentrionalis TaxID=420275 RepID=A0A7S2U9F3_9STRA|mmetsp:Transcript_13991/g.25306  ORF Transcript_13991/g.25306 Transcript_13991/m.25306 type:complete len:316 (+) Transcript_13991:109-1056(+)
MSDDEASTSTSGRGPRYTAWISLLAFSCISMGSFVSLKDKTYDSSTDKWVLSMTALSLCISAIAVIASVAASAAFVGKMGEMALSTMCTIFWCVVLGPIMNPDNLYATGGYFGLSTVLNANLYFSSWAAFIAAFWISGSLARDAKVLDVSDTTPKTAQWYLLLAASIVVLASSVKIYNASICDDFPDNSFCRRTKFAISIGVIGMVMALVGSIMSALGVMSPLIEVITSVTLFGLYCFGVGYITFGDGPGTAIGNLYFSTWAGFILSGAIFAASLKDMRGGAKSGDGDAAPAADEAKVDEEAPAAEADAPMKDEE